jgi:hypothetical protein
MKTSSYPLLLVVVLLLCNLTRSMAQQNVSTSPEIQIFYSGGSGTVGDPYQIANLTDLRYLSEHSADWNKYFKQTADIDATATNTWNVGNHDNNAGTATVAMGFSPIGNSTTNFSGKYDGQSHTISNLYINRPKLDYIGLFGYVTYDIRNLGLLNLSYTGQQYVGGIVGCAYSGTILNTFSKGTITGYSLVGGLVGWTWGTCTISDSYSEANVSGTNEFIAGLVGINWGTISKCYATGSVSGAGSWLAGLVGDNANRGLISESYATGNVNGNTTAGANFGGLVARNNNGIINNCYSTGNVTGYNYVGGLVGYIHLSTSSISNSYATGTVTTPTYERGGLNGANYFYATITNSYWDTQTTGIAISGTGGTGKTTAEMKTQATFTGWDFVTTPVWKINSNNNGYPYLAWQTYPSPEIDVKQGTTPIADGTGTYDFGNQNTSTNTDIIFTIENTGVIASTLGSFSITGTNADQFSIQGTSPTTVANANTTTFTVRFSPTSAGSKTAIVSFANQDANENPYNFTITGTGLAPVVVFSGGAGTLASPYQIATLADLRFLSENTSYWATGKYFIQTADIDATATNTWNVGNHDNDAGTPTVAMGFSPIGNPTTNFSGVYDGQSHTISNLYINRTATDRVGLFGYSNSSSTVRNTGLTNVFIVGHDRVGGLIGESRGSVTNCFSTGSAKGYWLVGGLIGLNYNSVIKSYSNVIVEGNNDIGGLIGQTWGGNISNSYATGSVRGNANLAGFIGLLGGSAIVDKCHAVGAVIGNIGSTFKGGFIGYMFTGSITNCYWDMETSEQVTSAAATGKTTAEMKTLGTFSNWDFVTTPVWKIATSENNGYPYLAWQYYPIIAPTVQASALTFSAVHNYDMTIGWTKGNGESRAVFVKEGTGAISNPVNQTTYTASTDWATKGTQLATSGYYCVYNGTGNSVTVTNLTRNTEYSVQVIEYNGGAGAEIYCTTTGTNNPLSQATTNESGTAVDVNNAIRLKVYPNPASDAFRVEGLSGVSSITISDLSGRIMLEKLVSDNEAIQIAALPMGVYIVKIVNNNIKKELKLVKGK